MNFLRRVLQLIGKSEPDDVEPVRPMVKPDPARAAELERRLAAVTYQPKTRPFLRDVVNEDVQ